MRSTALPVSAPSSWNVTRDSPGGSDQSTADGQSRPPIKFSPLPERTRGGSVETVTVSPASSGPCTVSVMSSVNATFGLPTRVKVMDDAGPVIVQVGHTSTSPGLVTLVSPRTCEEDTDGYGVR